MLYACFHGGETGAKFGGKVEQEERQKESSIHQQ